MLAETLYGASSVVLIDAPEECHLVRKRRDDLLLLQISRDSVESTDSIIQIMGDAGVVGRSWIYPVDMVVFGDIVACGDMLADRIDVWIPRMIHNGICVFLDYEHAKQTIDEKMEEFEQIAHAGNLVAYRITDEVTFTSWAMLTENADTVIQ